MHSPLLAHDELHMNRTRLSQKPYRYYGLLLPVFILAFVIISQTMTGEFENIAELTEKVEDSKIGTIERSENKLESQNSSSEQSIRTHLVALVDNHNSNLKTNIKQLLTTEIPENGAVMTSTQTGSIRASAISELIATTSNFSEKSVAATTIMSKTYPLTTTDIITTPLNKQVLHEFSAADSNPSSPSAPSSAPPPSTLSSYITTTARQTKVDTTATTR